MPGFVKNRPDSAWEQAEADAEAELRGIEEAKTAKVLAAAEAEMVIGAEKAKEPGAAERAAECRRIAGTPVGFCRTVLGLALYLWQAIVLSWFENTYRLLKASVCTPNGAGKSERIVGSIALWWISVHPQGRVVITTKDSKQLDNQIWPAIARHKGKFPKYDFIERMVRNGTGGFIIGFTTDDPGRVEGWHKIDDENGPLLIIEDEGKSVLEVIDMATDRCTYNAKLGTSSPGLTEGWIYRSQTSQAGEHYNAKGFEKEGAGSREYGYKAMKVGLIDCPHIPRSRIENILENYGPDHWFTQSTLHGEFTDADSDTLFVVPKHVVRGLMDSPPPYVSGSGRAASCDFAAGRNENVFTFRQGNRVIQHCWKDPDTMRAIGQFIVYFVQYGLVPHEIWGDAGGMGIVILQRMAELGWPINWVNNEAEPFNPVLYPNVGAETWHEGARKLAQNNLIIPNDPVLFDQLTKRRAAPATKGLLGLETKKEMAKRGVESPDRADGLLMVLNADVAAAAVLFDETGLAKLEGVARPTRAESGVLELSGQKAVFEPRMGGWLNVYERPIAGRSYICVVNPYRIEEVFGQHVVMVLRASYWDEREQASRPSRLAAKVALPVFRLDAGPLAELVKKVSGWYGGCMVVPIANDRGDVIQRLVEAGLNVYAREDFEVNRHGRRLTAIEFGWETDDFTRSMWIGALADKIREDRLVCEDLGTVMELYQLDARKSVKRQAEALGVGLQLENYASEYVEPERSVRVVGEREQGAARTMIG